MHTLSSVGIEVPYSQFSIVVCGIPLSIEMRLIDFLSERIISMKSCLLQIVFLPIDIPLYVVVILFI
nr:MAG TPA: hypothetical protein [Caudoviricetes sp.]